MNGSRSGLDWTRLHAVASPVGSRAHSRARQNWMDFRGISRRLPARKTAIASGTGGLLHVVSVRTVGVCFSGIGVCFYGKRGRDHRAEFRIGCGAVSSEARNGAIRMTACRLFSRLRSRLIYRPCMPILATRPQTPETALASKIWASAGRFRTPFSPLRAAVSIVESQTGLTRLAACRANPPAAR